MKRAEGRGQRAREEGRGTREVRRPQRDEGRGKKEGKRA